MISTRRFFQNAAAMVALAMLQRGMGLIAIFLLARILGVRGLGAYTFTQSTSQTFFGLVRLGADAGLHVSVAALRLPDNKRQADMLLGESLVLFLSIAVIATGVLVVLAHPIAATLFAAPEFAPFVAASAVLLAAQVVSQYCYAVFAGLNAFVVYARLTWATSLLTVTLTVICALLFGAVGAIWGAAIGGALAALALAVWLFRELSQRGVALRPRLPSGATVALLTVGFPFYLSGLVLIPADFLCVGYLSRIEGVGALGELRVVQSLMSLATVLPTALSGPLVSHLASRFAGSGGGDAVVVQLRAVWILSLGITISLATLWPLLVDIIFGTGFAAARSVGVLALLGFTPMMLFSVLTGAFLASRRSAMLLAIGLLQVLAVALAAHPLIFAFGLAGYLATQALYMGIGVVAAAFFLRRQLKGPLFRPWMQPLGALTIAISALIAWDLAVAESVSTRLAVGAGTLALLLLTCVTLVLTSFERRAIASSLSAVLRRLQTRARPTPAEAHRK